MLANLKTVDLTGSSVGDDGLQYLKSAPEVRNLLLAHTAITDSGVSNLTCLRQLNYLSLAATGVTDEGISNLVSFRQLKELDLEGTRVTDSSVDYLSALPLEMLNIRGTLITADGVVRLRRQNPGIAVSPIN
jgi:hypothetical protein